MTHKIYYRGFSTRNYEDSGKLFSVYNLECVEEDLLNEIFTVRGDRVNMPEFGTRIPLLVFELNDKVTMDVIREDLTTVFNNDPRVDVLSLAIIPSPEEYALVAVAKLFYKEFNVTKDLRITITSR